MKYGKFFVAAVFFSFSSFCNAREAQSLPKKLLENSSYVASPKQLPNEGNSAVNNVLHFSLGVGLGVAGAKVCDLIKNKVNDNDTDNRDSEIEELKLKLANTESELAECKSKNVTLNRELKLRDERIKCLLLELDCKESDNKEDDCLCISKGRAKGLSEMFSQIAERVSSAHCFGESLVCAARYLKENNVDISYYFNGIDNMDGVEKMGGKVHRCCIECASVLRRMSEHLQGKISLESVEKTWQESLEHLKKYNLDILN